MGETGKIEYLTMTDLGKRGWSKGLIAKLLGEPDRTSRNQYRRAAPVKLWEKVRVESAERHEPFLRHQQMRPSMVVRSRSSAERRKEELLDSIRDIQIDVVRWPLRQVRMAALASQEMRNIDRRDYFSSVDDADEGTKSRWMVNFIRHHLCTYDQELTSVANHVGVRDAVDHIRRRVYEKIADIYPELADECVRQADARGIRIFPKAGLESMEHIPFRSPLEEDADVDSLVDEEEHCGPGV